MRRNRKFIEARFAMAMDALGVSYGSAACWVLDPATGKHRAVPGVYFLDYAAAYGGYQVRRIANEAGAESLPFGPERHGGTAILAQLDGIIGTAEMLKAHFAVWAGCTIGEAQEKMRAEARAAVQRTEAILASQEGD